MKTAVSSQFSMVSGRTILLALGLVTAGWIASCDGGGGLRNAVFAQTAAAPAPPIGTFYSPEMNLELLDSKALGLAKGTIDLAAFSLTDDSVVESIDYAAAHGVKVRIYLDRGELQSECRGDITCARIPLSHLIGRPGVEIRVKFSKVLMHLKSYEVDNFLLRDGSANFSLQGERNQDNSAVFTQDGNALTGFERKFQAMWDRKDNLTVAQAVTAEH
jgi:phosphatidylserine/phosphatidylglycerophosphate/cardiolipin synthase-like enzyme